VEIVPSMPARPLLATARTARGGAARSRARIVIDEPTTSASSRFQTARAARSIGLPRQESSAAPSAARHRSSHSWSTADGAGGTTPGTTASATPATSVQRGPPTTTTPGRASRAETGRERVGWPNTTTRSTPSASPAASSAW